MGFLISILLGMIPEVLYLTLYIKFTKKTENKSVRLFILLALGYILLIMLCRYQLLFYLAYIVYTYLIVKILYKAHISDLFIISIAFIYMTLISFICFKMTNNYLLGLIINRISLFLPFIFKKYFNILYLNYKKLWNINKNAKIKSITLRNISLVIINIMILLFNICAVICTLDYINSK